MDSSYRPLSRAVQLALGGVMIAFAWLLLSVVFGLGAGDAHADDASEGGGALTSLTGAIDSATDRAVGGVAETAASVVESTVSAVTVVAPVTAPVVETVVETVEVVAEPVQEIVAEEPVSAVVAPVVDVVAAVPVVSEVVSGLGVGGALTEVAGTVDDVAGGLTGAVSTVVRSPAAGADAGAPSIWPDLPRFVRDLQSPAATAGAAASATGLAARGSVFSADWSREPSATEAASSGLTHVSPASSTPSSAPSPSSPFLPCGPGGGSSLGSGSAGPGAGALLALGPLVAHRAWVRRRGQTDDDVPPAPAPSTDVSPD